MQVIQRKLCMTEVVLHPGREKSVLRKHPWIYASAIAKVIGTPRPGETVNVISSTGVFLARAAYNPNSKIACRIWTWDEDEPIDAEFFMCRIRKALQYRQRLAAFIDSDAMRLVHAESDALPGLILDKYGDTFVVQFLTAGVEYYRTILVDVIKELTQASILYERSDVDVRSLEGLIPIKGTLFGEHPPKQAQIIENELKFSVDFVNGHKTGFYLDQRKNRRYARNKASGLRVLDCFSYTGGFAINTLASAAAAVTLVDSSNDALALANENIRKNNLDSGKVEIIEADVFKYMRTLRDQNMSYDMIILDPPKFAPTSAQAERAARAYKDINLLAFKILSPGGYLMTFSCSGGVSEELFQKIIASAACDAGVEATILERFSQSVDHPVALNFPEGAYLKGLLVQKRS